jgi:hypothetical protein
MGSGQKAHTAKLNIIAYFTGKFLLEKRGPLPGNAMLPRAPARGGTIAGQKMRANAQCHEIGTQAPLLGSTPAPRDPLLDTGNPVASKGEDQTVIARRRINVRRWIFKVGIGRQMPGHDHFTPPFRTACRSR